MHKLVGIVLAALIEVSLVACGQSAVRNYAAVLAANTGRLNDEFEQLTKSRQEIDAARDRLSNMLELSTLRAENSNERRLAEWSALKSNQTFAERYELFGMVRTYTDAAVNRQSQLESLGRKVVESRIEAKGQRSEQLAETAKNLAALSQEPTVEGKVKFLASYAKIVEESLKKAKDDATNASDSAKKKIDTVTATKKVFP